MQLSKATISSLPADVQKPAYDRDAVSIGVVHFGPGAFHRAHQACYFDSLLEKDPRWGICAVKLRPAGTPSPLPEQDNLYTVAELEMQPRFRVVGAIREYLSVTDGTDAIFARLTDPNVRLLTLTVTEKGYCLSPEGGLDKTRPEVLHDLENPHAPQGVIGWIVEGLRRRREKNIAPFIVMSCDNVFNNGTKLKRAVLDFARALNQPGLPSWIETSVRFPCTMVDSITPATTDTVRSQVAEAIGMTDKVPVQRERFLQWVVEDILAPDGPDLGAVGADMTTDVEAFELAKLRFLNGAHSTLAYAGLLRGATTVEGAMADRQLGPFVEAMMRGEIAATVRKVEGFDHETYISDILRRFRNPALSHQLYQIASDGSQKLPYRIFGTIADTLSSGHPIGRLALPVAAWMRFIEREAKAGKSFNDPLTDKLTDIGRGCSGAAADDLPRFFTLTSVFPKKLTENPRFSGPVGTLYDRFAKGLDIAL